MTSREIGSGHPHHQNTVEITGVSTLVLGDVSDVARNVSRRPTEVAMDFFPGGPANLRCLPDYGHKPQKRKKGKNNGKERGSRVKRGRAKRYTR